MKKHFFIKLAAIALLTGILCGGTYQGVLRYRQWTESKKEENIANQMPSEDDNQKELPKGEVTEYTPTPFVTADTSKQDVSGVVNKVMPALVSVQCRFKNITYDFFGRAYESESAGSGSGILMAQNNEELLIVTNHHVVADAASVEVMFIDETTAKAEVRGSEASEDLAVISVKLKDLKKETLQTIRIASLGSSDDLKLGQMVIAIGNALGYGQSTTVGYISAMDREVTFDDGTSMQLIQTDVAINPGNSGGALLNARGEVIGINNSKLVDSSVEGVCYAIPISKAVPIINELLNRETLADNEKAYMGISGQNVTKANAEALNMPVGIYIKEVEKGSPAEAAGLTVGNILTAVNGKTVEEMADLSRILSYTRGGSTGTLTIQVMRDGAYVEEELDITFGYQKKSK
ncbi:MAG: S1C family serine protease [Lachnospiraceae bacterium]